MTLLLVSEGGVYSNNYGIETEACQRAHQLSKDIMSSLFATPSLHFVYAF